MQTHEMWMLNQKMYRDSLKKDFPLDHDEIINRLNEEFKDWYILGKHYVGGNWVYEIRSEGKTVANISFHKPKRHN